MILCLHVVSLWHVRHASCLTSDDDPWSFRDLTLLEALVVQFSPAEQTNLLKAVVRFADLFTRKLPWSVLLHLLAQG